MNRRDIVIGIIILILVAGVVYWRQRNKKVEEFKVPETLSVEKSIEDKFKIEIPEDVEKAELRDVSGGNASGIATRKLDKGTFNLSVLVDLPDPERGKFYEAWLIKSEEGKVDYSLVSLGKLWLAKGGWMIDFKSQKDLSEYNKILVSLEEKSDKTLEKRILEGSF